ncbi:DUF397 domain-containing protein [Amycolatopsis sp. RTGN1]|uniref:DUF397 domain-containing protein n=1 Tax=Amycolatopsis ponsaeliensis TaxID=2992142 RepID=UPI00254A1E20|nr:DUF397 domain-containing protein [Amycolatopsis sp. RTGN1]
MTNATPSPSPSGSSAWFKSSHSNASGSCLEVRITTDATLVRDSKDPRPTSPVIQFEQSAWSSFLRVVATEAP